MTKSTGLDRREIVDIYNTYGALMRRRCRIVLRDEALADDVLQSVFVNLIRYGGSFREVDAKLRWLYTACDRACWALIDRRKRRTHREHVYIAPKPAPLTAQLEGRDEVMRVLASLEPELRDLAVLAYVDGLTQGQIAAKTQFSRQTINKKLKQIRDRALAFVEDEK